MVICAASWTVLHGVKLEMLPVVVFSVERLVLAERAVCDDSPWVIGMFSVLFVSDELLVDGGDQLLRILMPLQVFLSLEGPLLAARVVALESSGGDSFYPDTMSVLRSLHSLQGRSLLLDLVDVDSPPVVREVRRWKAVPITSRKRLRWRRRS